jgi:hypothetical protein
MKPIEFTRAAIGIAKNLCRQILPPQGGNGTYSPPYLIVTFGGDRVASTIFKILRGLGFKNLTDKALLDLYRKVPFSAPLHIEILSRRLIDKGRSGRGGTELGRVKLLFNWQAGHIASYLYSYEKSTEQRPESKPDTFVIFSRSSFRDIAEILIPEAVPMELEGFLFNPPGPPDEQSRKKILTNAKYWNQYYKELIAWFGPDVEGDFIAWRGHPHMFLASSAVSNLNHPAHGVLFLNSTEDELPKQPGVVAGVADPFLDEFKEVTGLALAEADLPESVGGRFYTSLPEIPLKGYLKSTRQQMADHFLPRLSMLCSGNILFVESPLHSVPYYSYEEISRLVIQALSLLVDANYSIDVSRHPDYGEKSLLDGSPIYSKVSYLPGGLPGELATECYDHVFGFYSSSLHHFKRGTLITMVDFLVGSGEEFNKIFRDVEDYISTWETEPIRLTPDNFGPQLKKLFPSIKPPPNSVILSAP